MITCAVDVQDDRVECKTVGWMPGEESHVIETKYLVGSPAEMLVWENLREFIGKTYLHERGQMRIIATTIDTGGHYTAKTYEFVKSCDPMSVFAIKGSSTPGSPISGKPSIQKNGVNLYLIGTDTIKNLLFSRLLIGEPGAGFIHFPLSLDEDYFKQLTAEKRTVKFKGGHKIHQWIQVRKRNEALDLMVYNIAALYIICWVVYPNLTTFQVLDTLHKSYMETGANQPGNRQSGMIHEGEQIE
jgi:phage terminase large subunit GpA-like protein